MLKKSIKLIFTLIIIIILIKTPIQENKIKVKCLEKEDTIGKLIIEKINLYQNLYPINDSRNNIEENVTILKESIMPNKNNSIVFIAAHSGTGKIAYFNDLDKLEINDNILLIYENKEYYYKIIEIWEENKNGYINVNKSKENQLVLTTCSKNKNKQLVINSIEKDS